MKLYHYQALGLNLRNRRNLRMTPVNNVMSSFDEPLILAIDTATRSGSVALALGSEILSSAEGNASESHSISLLEAIENILQQIGVKLSDIDLFAAASGPGSFTGLRIGLATTKAFAVCAGKKCRGISTLAAIAHAAGESEHTIALLPAGRGELFAQLFAVNAGSVHPLDSAAHMAPAAVRAKYSQHENVTVAGEGAHVYSEALGLSANAQRQADEQPRVQAEKNTWTLALRCDQLAPSIAALALNEYRCGNVVDPEDLHADYVRASDAEIKEKWQQQKS